MNKVCEQLKGLRTQGNIIPNAWYDLIKTDAGRTDLVAINILADVIYWYRPTEIRDEQTGMTTGYKQKFIADKLQKSYQAYSDMLGVHKRTVKRAINNLERLGLIRKEFRNIKSKSGMAINNVMYLEPILKNIVFISETICQGVGDKIGYMGGAKCQGVGDKIGKTNTKTPTKIKTKTSTKRLIKLTATEKKIIERDDINPYFVIWKRETSLPIKQEAGDTTIQEAADLFASFIEADVTPAMFCEAIRGQMADSRYKVTAPHSVKTWAMSSVKKKGSSFWEKWSKRRDGAAYRKSWLTK